MSNQEYENPAAHFAGRLKELRTAAGLTQQELADRAGLSRPGIADLEQARREPSWSTVLALSTALGVTCRDFQTPPSAEIPARRGRPGKGTPPSG